MRPGLTLKTAGLITATAKGSAMTLAELAAFAEECLESGVPGDSAPTVGTSWKGGIKRIGVTRPVRRV